MITAYIVKVHRLDRESSGLHLMGRTEESISHLHLLFTNTKKSKSLSKVLSLQPMQHLYFSLGFFSFPSSTGERVGILLSVKIPVLNSLVELEYFVMHKALTVIQGWNDACESTYQRYWALVIGSPKEKEGVISAPLTKVFHFLLLTFAGFDQVE